MLSQRFDSTVAVERNVVWFLHRGNQVPQATMKENPGFAHQLGTHGCDSNVQIDSAMQFGDTRHVDTENGIESDFRADHASNLDIIGMAENVAHQVHLQLDQILDGVAQVQRVPFDFGFHPYGYLIQKNPNVSFRIDAGCRMPELRGDAAIWYLCPFGMDHAIKEVSVHA
ncbi:Uncharacterised protein [Burkholderia pseudomallei]|nr:Uncharacterised protein [Burkholderia pseudomallei]